MSDDTFCVFIIAVCLIAIVMPGPGNIIIGFFGLVLGSAALLFPAPSKKGEDAPPRHHHATGQ